MYFAVTDSGYMSHTCSFSAFDIECCGYDLNWFLEKFFSPEHMSIGCVQETNDQEYDEEDDVYEGDDEMSIPDDSDAWANWCDKNANEPDVPAPSGYNSWSDWYDDICSEYDDYTTTIECAPAPIVSTEDIAEKIGFSNDQTLISGINGMNSNYSRYYYLMLDESGKPLQTATGEYLSRMTSQRGKHRYYLTSVTPELESDDHERLYTFYVLKSKFVGFSMASVLALL